MKKVQKKKPKKQTGLEEATAVSRSWNNLVSSYDVHLVEIANIVWGRNNLMTVQTLWVYLNFEQCKLWVDKP